MYKIFETLLNGAHLQFIAVPQQEKKRQWCSSPQLGFEAACRALGVTWREVAETRTHGEADIRISELRDQAYSRPRRVQSR